MLPDHLTEDFSKCLKCPVCQPACQTYKLTRMEGHSPRGRVQMVKDYLEGDPSLSKGLAEAFMSCLICEPCVAACPSGAHLERLFENMRVKINETVSSKPVKKAPFAALNNPILMTIGPRVARSGMDVVPFPRHLGFSLGNIPLDRLPSFNKKPFRNSVARMNAAAGQVHFNSSMPGYPPE